MKVTLAFLALASFFGICRSAWLWGRIERPVDDLIEREMKREKLNDLLAELLDVSDRSNQDEEEEEEMTARAPRQQHFFSVGWRCYLACRSESYDDAQEQCRCYLVGRSKSYDDAQKQCTDKGAHLAVFETNEERENVDKAVRDQGHPSSFYFVGAKKHEGDHWTWDDTDTVVEGWVNSMFPMQGEGDCVIMMNFGEGNSNSGKLTNWGCSGQGEISFICEQ